MIAGLTAGRVACDWIDKAAVVSVSSRADAERLITKAASCSSVLSSDDEIDGFSAVVFAHAASRLYERAASQGAEFAALVLCDRDREPVDIESVPPIQRHLLRAAAAAASGDEPGPLLDAAWAAAPGRKDILAAVVVVAFLAAGGQP